MAPAYKLTYFEIKGKGEAIRFLFKYGGVDFEDFVVKKDEWPKLKTTMPFGQVPVLEHNGKIANQSIAICRYVARIVKLAGSDDFEDLEIDAVVDTIDDLRTKCVAAFVEKDAAKKKTLTEIAIKETVPYFFSHWDAAAKTNNGYLALGRLTWADLFLISLRSSFELFMGCNPFDHYPNLKILKEKVEGLPGIKEWIEIRPKTDR